MPIPLHSGSFLTPDRFIAMKYAYRHKEWVTRSRVYATIAVIWLFSAVATSTQFWASPAIIDWLITLGTLVGSVCFLVSIPFMVTVAN